MCPAYGPMELNGIDFPPPGFLDIEIHYEQSFGK